MAPSCRHRPSVAPTWRGLGATDLGAELSATDLGAELGTMDLGAERASFTPRPLPFPERACIVLPSFSGFLSPSSRPTLGFVVFDRENFDFIRRSSRARYYLSPPKFVHFIGLLYVYFGN